MYLDHQTVFSEAQAVATTDGATASTNYLDLGAAVRLGIEDLDILVRVSAITATPTLSIAVEADSDSAFGTAVTVTTVAKAVVANERLIVCIPPSAAKRYYRLKYTVTGSGAAATITALFQNDDQIDTQKP